ncbi:PREDICTED: uncharacterized protein LOC108765773, partial [Trachymyrmex cornetzi]
MDNAYCTDCGELLDSSDHICCLNKNEESNNNWEPFDEIVLQSEVPNIEELINEVFRRPPLWNSSLPYENRGPATIKFLWSEIDEKLNLYPGTACSKWRNLRDTYVRKLSEQNKYVPSGSAAEAKPKPVSWPYFELMGFLRSTVTRRKTFSNIKPLIPSTNKNKCYLKEPLKERDQNSTCVTPSNYRSSTYKND